MEAPKRARGMDTLFNNTLDGIFTHSNDYIFIKARNGLNQTLFEEFKILQ
jgi:hypothetical protein